MLSPGIGNFPKEWNITIALNIIAVTHAYVKRSTKEYDCYRYQKTYKYRCEKQLYPFGRCGLSTTMRRFDYLGVH